MKQNRSAAGGDRGAAAWVRDGRGALLAVVLSLAAITLVWLIARDGPSAGGAPPNLVVFTAAPAPAIVATPTLPPAPT